MFNGRLIDEEPHLDRLDYSLGELRIAWPMSRAALRFVCRELHARQRPAARHRLYAGHPRRRAARPQVSRRGEAGAGGDHKNTMGRPAARMIAEGARVITIPDIRWRRCDIKSVVAAAERARQAGGGGAGRLRGLAWSMTTATSPRAPRPTPGSSRRTGALVTRQLEHRDPRRHHPRARCSSSSPPEASAGGAAVHARRSEGGAEAFLTSSTSLVLPVTRIDGTRSATASRAR